MGFPAAALPLAATLASPVPLSANYSVRQCLHAETPDPARAGKASEFSLTRSSRRRYGAGLLRPERAGLACPKAWVSVRGRYATLCWPSRWRCCCARPVWSVRGPGPAAGVFADRMADSTPGAQTMYRRDGAQPVVLELTRPAVWMRRIVIAIRQPGAVPPVRRPAARRRAPHLHPVRPVISRRWRWGPQPRY